MKKFIVHTYVFFYLVILFPIYFSQEFNLIASINDIVYKAKDVSESLGRITLNTFLNDMYRMEFKRMSTKLNQLSLDDYFDKENNDIIININLDNLKHKKNFNKISEFRKTLMSLNGNSTIKTLNDSNIKFHVKYPENNNSTGYHKNSKKFSRRSENSLNQISTIKLSEFGKRKMDLDAEYTTQSRNLTLIFPENNNSCSLKIVDRVTYLINKNTKIVEHLILNNNYDSLENVEVFSENEETDVNFYSYNKKLNIISVFFTDYLFHRMRTKRINKKISKDYDKIQRLDGKMVKSKNNIDGDTSNLYDSITFNSKISDNQKNKIKVLNISKNTKFHNDKRLLRNINSSSYLDNSTFLLNNTNENTFEKDNSKTILTLRYEYTATNIIKLEKDNKVSNESQLIVNSPNNALVGENNNSFDDIINNSIVWKVINQNFNDNIEKLHIDIQFPKSIYNSIFEKIKFIPDNFIKFEQNQSIIKNTPQNFSNVLNESESNTTSSDISGIKLELTYKENHTSNKESSSNFITYSLNKALSSHEVLVLKLTFSAVYNGCEFIKVSGFVIVLGALFLIFLMSMIYVLLNSILFGQNSNI